MATNAPAPAPMSPPTVSINTALLPLDLTVIVAPVPPPVDIGRTRAPQHTMKIFNPQTFPKLIDLLELRLTELICDLNFNCIAGSGNSGLVVLGALAIRLGLPILTVRKYGDSAIERGHDVRMVNGHFVPGGTRYLIIDDLIASGTTVDRIVHNIHKESRAESYGDTNKSAVPVGILTYNSRYSINGEPHIVRFGQGVPHYEIPTFFVVD